MAPLTAYHRTPLPPTGVSHALSCKLFQTKTRSTTHLITARDTTLSIWEVTVRPPLFTILTQFKLIEKESSFAGSNLTFENSQVTRYNHFLILGENLTI